MASLVKQINPIYDQIGRSYDETRSADPNIVTTICKLLSPKTDGHYLDIGCGSGNYTVALAQQGHQMTGIDISEKMLGKARKKSQSVSWHNCDAKKLQFNDCEFNGAICILAIHHIQEFEKIFCEEYRVLKPGTRFVIFTSTPEQIRSYWLCHYFPKMMEDGCKMMASQHELILALTKAGFSDFVNEKFFIDNDLKDWFLHAGKYQPEIYLNPAVRAGISTFAKVPDSGEVEAGLCSLKEDIENNTIKAIIEKYENQKGDYLFLSATKS